mmetsp:Transcript_24881/g.62010  ORF Transcript_24881/g.62010 Transcript_24881/m.62010 type:complete len:257 (+) Transcript_24881:879-1649(+)
MRPGAGADSVRARGGGRAAGGADGARRRPHNPLWRVPGGGRRARRHWEQRRHPPPAAHRCVGRVGRRQARRRHVAGLRAMLHPRAVPARGQPTGRIVQPARALRRRHGSRHLLRGHGAQGGGGAAGAYANGRGGFCAAGRAHRNRHGHGGAERSQPGALPQAPGQPHYGRARGDDDQDGRAHGAGHRGCGRAQRHHRLARTFGVPAHDRRCVHAGLHAVLVLVAAGVLRQPHLRAHRVHRPGRTAEDAALLGHVAL